MVALRAAGFTVDFLSYWDPNLSSQHTYLLLIRSLKKKPSQCSVVTLLSDYVHVVHRREPPWHVLLFLQLVSIFFSSRWLRRLRTCRRLSPCSLREPQTPSQAASQRFSFGTPGPARTPSRLACCLAVVQGFFSSSPWRSPFPLSCLLDPPSSLFVHR